MRRLIPSLILACSGCIGRTASPDTAIGSRVGDSATTLGDIALGGDSVALWLAIAFLGLSSIMGGLFYMLILRPWRRARERKNGAENGLHPK